MLKSIKVRFFSLLIPHRTCTLPQMLALPEPTGMSWIP